MDNATKQAVESLLSELHKLNAHLKILLKGTALQKKQNDGSAGNSNHTTQENENYAKSKWYRPFEWWKSRLEALAFVSAIIYAGLTYLQWNDLRRNFSIDERSWVAMEAKATGPLKISPNGASIEISLDITNVGKTPAQFVRESVTMDTLSSGREAKGPIERNCRDLSKIEEWNSDTSSTYFPTKTYTHGNTAMMDATLMQQAIKDNIFHNGQVALVVNTCIDYFSSIDPKHRHQTGQTYAISRKDESGHMTGAFEVGKEYPDAVLIRLGQSFGN